jgi:hypothetical protein
MSGSWASAQAIDSRCRWPPDSLFSLVSALSDRPTSSSMSAAVPALTPYSEANVSSCSRAVSFSKNDDACSCTPMRGSSFTLRGHGFSPNSVTLPSSGLRSPSMISNVVVLPAPLGPRIPKNSPSPTVNDTPSTAHRSPYRLRSPSATIVLPLLMAGTVGLRGSHGGFSR